MKVIYFYYNSYLIYNADSFIWYKFYEYKLTCRCECKAGVHVKVNKMTQSNAS